MGAASSHPDTGGADSRSLHDRAIGPPDPYGVALGTARPNSSCGVVGIPVGNPAPAAANRDGAVATTTTSANRNAEEGSSSREETKRRDIQAGSSEHPYQAIPNIPPVRFVWTIKGTSVVPNLGRHFSKRSQYPAAVNQDDDTADGSFHYIWRVEGLSPDLSDQSFHAQFKAKGLEWELSLLTDQSLDYGSDQRRVGVRLYPRGGQQPDVNMRLTYIITLFNRTSGHQDWPRSEINAFAGRDGKWGFRDFIASDVFFDPNNGFVVDGVCELGIKLLRVGLFRVKNESRLVHHKLVTHDHTWVVSNFSAMEHGCWRREEFDAAGCRWSIYLHRTTSNFMPYVNDNVMLFLSLDSLTSDKKSLTVNYQFHVKGLVEGYEFCDACTNVFVPGQCHGHYLRMPLEDYQRLGWNFEKDTCIVRVRLAPLGYIEAKSNDARDSAISLQLQDDQ